MSIVLMGNESPGLFINDQGLFQELDCASRFNSEEEAFEALCRHHDAMTAALKAQQAQKVKEIHELYVKFDVKKIQKSGPEGQEDLACMDLSNPDPEGVFGYVEKTSLMNTALMKNGVLDQRSFVNLLSSLDWKQQLALDPETGKLNFTPLKIRNGLDTTFVVKNDSILKVFIEQAHWMAKHSKKELKGLFTALKTSSEKDLLQGGVRYCLFSEEGWMCGVSKVGRHMLFTEDASKAMGFNSEKEAECYAESYCFLGEESLMVVALKQQISRVKKIGGGVPSDREQAFHAAFEGHELERAIQSNPTEKTTAPGSKGLKL